MKGFSGGPGNMQALMKQAQKMQQDLKRAQEETEQIEAEGSAGGGAVKVTANGKNQLTAVLIEKAAINPDDAEMLQDLVLAAANEALTKVQESAKAALSKVTGGMNIPGLL